MNLISITNNASTPDIYFDFNDANNNANWGTGISANINLGATQRYFFGNDNHDSFGNYGQSADAYISGNISGSGGISFIAQNSYEDGEVSQTDFVLAGDNTFSGEVEIQRGALYLVSPDALTQNNVLVLDPEAGFNAWFYLYGNNTTVTNLQASGNGTSIIANSPGNSVGGATLTILESSDTVYAGTFSDVQSDYSPNEGGGPLSIAVTGTNTLALTGTSSISGSVSVDPSTLTNNGTLTAASGFSVSNGSILNGAGTDAGSVNVSGTLEAGTGSATGILTTGDLSFGSGGIVAIQLNGTTAGSGYDQLSVTNVDLTGATLVANLGSGFNPIVGTTFEIISNTGGNPVNNTFTGLPEGAAAMIGGLPFTISYVGGDGNDVTLTRTSATITSDPVGPITLGTSVTFTATIANAGSANAGTVSFYFDYGLPGQVQIGGAVNLVNGSATSDSTASLPAGSDTITVVYSDGTGSTGILGTVTIQVNSSTPAPTITDVVLNQNITALNSGITGAAQRSMVEDIVYTFSEPVNIASNLVNPNLFQINALTVNGVTGVVPATIEWAAVAGSGGMQWEVDFGVNSSATNSQVGALNSIANGCYTITITNFSQITAVSDGQAANINAGAAPGVASSALPGYVQANANYAQQSFYRLFGDGNGDMVVNPGDNNKFKAAITTYNPAFDFNQDGVVNPGDNNRFKANLTVTFVGFTETI